MNAAAARTLRWLAPVLLGVGGPCPASPADPWDALSRLPPTVDAAAVLDRPGTRLWSEPAGRAVRAALSATGVFSQTERAWAGLAEALGYTENQAAAALLGGRVVVAWDGLARADASPGGAAGRADTRWAVIAGVDPATARSVRERLKAAPRRTVAGRVVYTVDAGRTAMAVVDGPEGTRVVFAPVSAAGLLDALLAAEPSVPSSPAPVGEAARGTLGAVEPGWLAVAAVRLPSGQPAAFEVRPDPGAPGALAARFATRTDSPDAQSETPPGAPVGVLAEVGGDALFAAAFRGGPRFGPSEMDLGVRLGLGAHDTDDGPLRPGRGSVLVLQGVEPGGVAARLIAHVRSDGPFAETVDRAVSAAVGGHNPPHHRGAFPRAVRAHDLPSDPARPGWPGPGGRAAWCFVTDGPDDAIEPGASGAVSVAFAPQGIDPAPLARSGREAWERAPFDDPGVLTAGRARPRELVQRLEARTSAATDLAASVEAVTWSVRAVGSVMTGEIRLRFAEPGPRLGAP